MESHVEQVATCRESPYRKSLCRAVAVEASRVGCRKLNWIWPGRLPLGKVSLVVGESGRGKSFLACEIAAKITSGQKWADGKELESKGSVLMLSADDARDTVLPRLITAGADLEKVVLLGSSGGGRLEIEG